MPHHKSAIKRLRQDKKRRLRNKRIKSTFKRAIKKFRKEKTPELLKAAYSALDKAVKKKVIHKNTAARKKSKLAKALFEEQQKSQL